VLRDFSLLQNAQTCSEILPTSYLTGTEDFFGDKEDCCLKLTIHIRRVSRLKMSGVVTTLYAFMSWIGIRLPLPFIPVVIVWVPLYAQ
jgi:hypothetical protein